MKTQSYTFAAGESINLGAGNFLQYMRGEGPLDIRFYHGRGEIRDERADEARPGYATEPPRRVPNDGAGESIGFTSVVITSPTAQTVQIGISYGRGAYNRFTGDVELTSPLDGDGHLETADAKAKAVLNSILSMAQNPTDQRAPLTTLEGASKVNITGSMTQTVVTAANNVNGVIIRHAWVSAHGNSEAELTVDGGEYLFVKSGSDNGAVVMKDDNTFVPAGQKIEINTGGAGRSAVWYEVL